MTKKIFITRKEITKLKEICEKFPTVNRFEIQSVSNNGIGSVCLVKFSLFDSKNDVTVDITDIESW